MAFSSRLAQHGIVLLLALGGLGAVADDQPERGTTPIARQCAVAPAAELPEFSEPAPPAPTAQSLHRAGITGHAATWIVPAEGHRWEASTGKVETVDGSLRLRGVTYRRDSGVQTLTLTLLLDYAPVEAHYRIWSKDRSKLLHDETTRGVWMPIEDDTVAFDIELPRNAVQQGHWREVQTVVWLAPAGLEETSDADVRRWLVFNGTRPPDPRPCFTPVTEPAKEHGSHIAVENGQLVFTFSPASSGAYAWVPINRGTPQGPAQIWRLAEDEKTSVTVPAPDGHTFITVWRDPWQWPVRPVWVTNFLSSNLVGSE